MTVIIALYAVVIATGVCAAKALVSRSKRF